MSNSTAPSSAAMASTGALSVDNGSLSTPSDLPLETVAFANRMFDAARQGNSQLLLAAIDAGLPPNLTNSSGNSLLMLSAYAGHAELTSSLLSRGARPNALNERGQSPLAGAVFKGHDAVVKVLVQGGANPSLGQPNAIDSAYMFGRMDQYFPLFGVGRESISRDAPALPSEVGR